MSAPSGRSVDGARPASRAFVIIRTCVGSEREDVRGPESSDSPDPNSWQEPTSCPAVDRPPRHQEVLGDLLVGVELVGRVGDNPGHSRKR
jgi:hypothetical protein